MPMRYPKLSALKAIHVADFFSKQYILGLLHKPPKKLLTFTLLNAVYTDSLNAFNLSQKF